MHLNPLHATAHPSLSEVALNEAFAETDLSSNKASAGKSPYAILQDGGRSTAVTTAAPVAAYSRLERTGQAGPPSASSHLYEVPLDDGAGGSVVITNRSGSGEATSRRDVPAEYEVPLDDIAGGSVLVLSGTGAGNHASHSNYATPRQGVTVNAEYEVPLDDDSGGSVIVVRPAQVYSTATNA